MSLAYNLMYRDFAKNKDIEYAKYDNHDYEQGKNKVQIVEEP